VVRGEPLSDRRVDVGFGEDRAAHASTLGTHRTVVNRRRSNSGA
jgi:hypothetical protein